ncbi:MAG TPA: D-glucuronyl C5-epimerase family protein [Caulobacter sp.]|nr:D-glucuronyl C5-epimerase family protein [Caulobacter sp.]
MVATSALAGPTAKIGGKIVNCYPYTLASGFEATRPLSLAPSENGAWQPKTPTDYPFPWPAAWIAWGQPFNPYTFALDAAVMRGEAKRRAPNPIYSQMAANLDKMAMEVTQILPSGSTQIVHKFGYEVGAGINVPPGFRGAFANSMVAVGYMHLNQMTGDKAYLLKARKMLDGMTDTSGPQPLFTIDANGYLWFEEVISKDVNIGVYNGHMGAVFAMLEYRRLTKDPRYDEAIRAGITTMAYWLPQQRRPEGFFAYARDTLHSADYGQVRAVIMAEALCAVTTDYGLCGEAKAFRSDYDYREKAKVPAQKGTGE